MRLQCIQLARREMRRFAAAHCWNRVSIRSRTLPAARFLGMRWNSNGGGETEDDSDSDSMIDETNTDLNQTVTSSLHTFLDRSTWHINPDLDSYISAPSDEPDRIPGPQFSLTFLGTGAGTVRVKRSCTATALVLGGDTFLFDAGEGVQRQSQLSKRVRLGDVKNIFITHLHGDHIFGLPGLLLSLQHIGKHRETQIKASKQPRAPGPTAPQQATDDKNFKQPKLKSDIPPIRVYGPVGLYNYIAASLSLSCTELKFAPVEVYELTGGSRRWVHPASIKQYSEFRHRGLTRHRIPQNKDGTWTLMQAQEVSTIEEARHWNDSRAGVTVRAAQIWHVTKLQCFGYVVQEPHTQERRIDVEKARAAGMEPSQNYKYLKLGFSMPSDDGSRMVNPEDVWISDELPNKSRKVAILGDCSAVPRPMAELCQDADVLVHEATFLESASGARVDFGGHSTAAMAARVAQQVQAKVLLLNHISAIQATEEKMVVDEAEQNMGKNAITKVQLTYDLMDFHIPRKGFPESLLTNQSSASSTEENGKLAETTSSGVSTAEKSTCKNDESQK